MKIRKRFIALLLAAALCICGLPVEEVHAEEITDVQISEETEADSQTTGEESIDPQPSEDAAAPPESEELVEESASGGPLIQEGGFPEAVSEETKKLLGKEPSAETSAGEPGAETAVTEESLEEYLLRQLENLETEINVSQYEIPKEQIFSAYSAILNSHPELWYVAGALSWSYVPDTGYTYTIKPTYTADAEKIAENNERLKEEAEKCLATVKDSMTDLEKALAVHDHLVLDCAYDLDYEEKNILTSNDWNIIGPIVDKSCVCQGYALAFLYYMNELGIPCETISSADHMWNVIELDGQRFHIDCTWDDPTSDLLGRVGHNYFLCSDEAMLAENKTSHVWKESYSPNCLSAVYDNAELKGCISQIVFHEGEDAVYYAAYDKDSYNHCIMRGELDEGLNFVSTTVIKAVSDKWTIWDSNAFYTNCMRIAATDDYLFYNTPTELYRMDYSGNETRIDKEDTSAEGHIYGMCLLFDDSEAVIRYELRKDYNKAEFNYKQCDISDMLLKPMLPVSELSYTIPAEGIIFDGRVHMIEAAVKEGVEGAGTITVFYENEDGNKVTEPTDCGTYQVFVAMTEGASYRGVKKAHIGQFRIVPKAVGTSLTAEKTAFADEDVVLNAELTGMVDGVAPTGSICFAEEGRVLAEEALTKTSAGAYAAQGVLQAVTAGTHKYYAYYVPGEMDNYRSAGNSEEVEVTVSITEPTKQPPAGTKEPSAGTEKPDAGKDEGVRAGDVFTAGKLTYRVLTTGEKGTVAVAASTNKKLKSVTIPNTVAYAGVSYTVTEIGSKAFYKCKKLKKITIRATKLRKVGKKAFSGIDAKAVIKVPKKNLKAYKKLLKGKGQKKSVTIK